MAPACERDDKSLVGDAAVVREVFEQLPYVVVAFGGADHRVVAANAAYRALAGVGAVVGRPVAEVFPEMIAQQVFPMFDRVHATGEPAQMREWRVQVDTRGDEVVLDVDLVPRRGVDGAVAGVTCYVTDVTAAVQARERERGRAQDAERRYRAAREVVAELQRELLPRTVPVLPGVGAAACYLVASDDQTAGGDWFDVVPLDNGSVAAVVGDVVGHGVAASAAMGRLRTVLSTALVATGDLDAALRWTDRFAEASPQMRAATVAVLILDPNTGSMHYATCGHLPALVVDGDGASNRFLPTSGAGPLGTGSALSTATDRLEPGQAVLLFSDGLVERPGRPLAEGLADLAQVTRDAAANKILPLGAPDAEADRLAQQCVELLTRTGYDDDVTAVALHRRPAPVTPLDLELTADPNVLVALARDLRGWLSSFHAGPADVEALDLAANELVVNALEHAYHDAHGPIRVRAELTPHGDVVLSVTDDGTWVEPGPPPATSGRGLWMAGAAVDTLTITHPGSGRGGEGTVVTATRAMTHPANLATETTLNPAPSAPAREFDVVVDRNDDGSPSTLHISGRVDLVTAPHLADTLDVATRGGMHAVGIDLNHVDMLASAGVSVLFALQDQLAIHGHPLAPIADDETPAAHVLDLVGLARRPRN